jgi:hypothetical protein
VICIVLGMSLGIAQAGTILTLKLGSDTTPDIKFDGTTLSTDSDSVPATMGDQDTEVDFQDFLSGMSDLVSPPGSATLGGLTVSGPPTVFGGVLVVQDFILGTIDIWGPAPGNNLLLSGTLNPFTPSSTLAGPLGPPATGALFTTSFATVTGGSLAPLLVPNSLTLSMSLSNINGGGGLAVGGPIGGAQTLLKFGADAVITIAAEPVPEPTGAALLGLGVVLAGAWTYRRHV